MSSKIRWMTKRILKKQGFYRGADGLIRDTNDVVFGKNYPTAINNGEDA